MSKRDYLLDRLNGWSPNTPMGLLRYVATRPSLPAMD